MGLKRRRFGLLCAPWLLPCRSIVYAEWTDQGENKVLARADDTGELHKAGGHMYISPGLLSVSVVHGREGDGG